MFPFCQCGDSGAYGILTVFCGCARSWPRPWAAFDVYAVVSDAAANPDPAHVNYNTTLLTLLGVMTRDVRAPRLVGQYTAGGAIAAVLPASFEIVVQLTEPGRVWYVVTPHLTPAVALSERRRARDVTAGTVAHGLNGGAGSTASPRVQQRLWADAPTPEEIVHGTGSRRAPAAACGVFEVLAAGVNTTAQVQSVAEPWRHPGCAEFAQGGDGFYGIVGLRATADGAGEGGVGASFYGLSGLPGPSDKAGVDPPLCRACPLLSPEGAYDVWLIAEDVSQGGARGQVNRQTEASRAAAVNPADPSGPSVGIRVQGAGFRV